MPAFTKFVYTFPDTGIVDLTPLRMYHIDHLSKSAAATLLSNSMLPTSNCLRKLVFSDMPIVVSTLQAGCFFGSLLAYYIADRWGRKVVLQYISIKGHLILTFLARSSPLIWNHCGWCYHSVRLRWPHVSSILH